MESDAKETLNYISLVKMGPEESYVGDRSRLDLGSSSMKATRACTEIAF